MSINHLSASSIDTFQRCQLQWYHRYVLGERQPPSIALVQGGSVHKSAEYEYAYKLEAGEDAPLDECLDVARDTFELEAEQVEDWEGTKPSAVLDETVNLARLYREELAPAVMPVSVEREILLSDESWPWPLLGYVDVEYDFFFQAEDGIRDAQESRGLGDVYKRQDHAGAKTSFV